VPAIVNAVFAATGKRPREMPVDASLLKQAVSASFIEVSAMIHELRVYQAVPGQMAKLQARFRDQLPPIWEKHCIHAIGSWTTLIGGSSDQLTYILQWESLADLETRWTAFLNDSAWHKVRDEGERDGPIVASISNQILTPTAFSALK
jgi:hypothetical protein